MKRTALYALAATVVIGFGALVSSVAEARPHGGGHRGVGGHHGHHRVHIGHHRHHGHRPHFHRHHHHRPRLTIRGCYRHPWLCRPIVRPGYCWRHPWRCQRPIVRYPVYPIAAAPVAAAPVAVASAPCTCLRKTYLPNGAVLFQDICTNEAAVNPPQQAAEGPQEPAPQQ